MSKNAHMKHWILNFWKILFNGCFVSHDSISISILSIIKPIYLLINFSSDKLSGTVLSMTNTNLTYSSMIIEGIIIEYIANIYKVKKMKTICMNIKLYLK